MGASVIRSIGIVLPALLAASLLSCQRSSPHFSDGSASSTTQLARSGGGGDGIPYEGLVAMRYVHLDPLNPCPEKAVDGTPLPDAEITIRGSTASLTRDACTEQSPAPQIAPSELLPAADGSGNLLYNGRSFAPAPSNLLLQSATLNGAAWRGFQGNGIPGAAVSPDGATNATFLVEDRSLNSWHYLAQSPAFNYSPGQTLTFSVYAKAGTRRFITLHVQDGTTWTDQLRASFDLQSGVLTSTQSVGLAGTASGAISPVGNGWFRISVTGVPTVQYRNVEVDVCLESILNGTTYNGDGASGLYVWGAQLEQGASASTFLPVP